MLILTSLKGGHAVCLLNDFTRAEFKQQLVELYQPDFIRHSNVSSSGPNDDQGRIKD